MKGYIDFILNNAPRVMTQIDRDRDSLSYGSCDRNYWHLKIRDFSSAILQQSALSLALLYTTDFHGNCYYQNSHVKEWGIAALKYLSKIQLSDGSFNEYYPYEHGYPPTAFNLVAGCLTYQELQLQDKSILDTLEKTGVYLSNNSETSAYNQEIAAITGLYLLYRQTGNEKYLQSSQKKLASTLCTQSEEGWFPEQGGADIGYSSVALDMLSEYYWHSKDEAVLNPIKKLVEFLSYFVHPDGTIGGEYGSRNTTYLMPNGFATMEAQGNPLASAINHFVFEQIDPNAHFMNSVDERYLSHYVIHSFLRAWKKLSACQMSPPIVCNYQLPCFQPHYKMFKSCGLMTVCTKHYFAVCAPSKGGILKIYKGRTEVAGDYGYRHKCGFGKVSATNWLDPKYEIIYSGHTVTVSGYFNIVKQKLQNPIYHLGLRVSSLLFGRKINSAIKKLLLFTDKHEKIRFERNIIFDEGSIQIRDNIINDVGTRVTIHPADNFSLRLVASGKFFSTTDLLTSIDTKEFAVTDTAVLEKTWRAAQ